MFHVIFHVTVLMALIVIAAISINQSIKFISRSTCTKMNKKYIFHKLTGKRWKLKLATYKQYGSSVLMNFSGSLQIVKKTDL